MAAPSRRAMKTKVSLMLGAILATTGSHRAAWAEEPANPSPTHAGRSANGARAHEGLYLRLGIGFGSFYDYLAREMEGDPDEFNGYGTVSGVTTTSEIAIGGTPVPGLVLGGGIYGQSLLASTLVVEDELESPEPLPVEIDPAARSLLLAGPFIDYWFRPGGGFHFQTALGFASLTGLRYEQGRVDGDELALGGGVMAGFGHEWWASDEWGVGVLGRFVGAILFQEDEAGNDWIHVIGTMPSVLFTVSYH